MAFRESGCIVEVVCPAGHPVAKTQAAEIVHSFRGLRAVQSFRDAIVSARPNLIVPCDDLAVSTLSGVYRQAQERNATDLLQVLELSIGNPATQAVCCSRSRLMDLAAAGGIRTAGTSLVSTRKEVRNWLVNLGVPAAVLKADGTSGGVGVIVASTLSQAERAFRKLKAPPLILRAAKRALLDRDMNLVVPCLTRRQSTVSIQEFIEGHEATSTIACWQGRILSSLNFEVLRSWETRGPASVLRLVNNPDMHRSAELLVQSLNLSGIYGFDFVLQNKTQLPYLIEMNARATQTSHLALGLGKDLVASLHGVLSDVPTVARTKVTDKDVIVLFPTEWRNDPNSTFLTSGYHDVPWSEPELVKDCVLYRRKVLGSRSSVRWPDHKEESLSIDSEHRQPVLPDDTVVVKRGVPDA
jgi:hypothetical protein